MCTMYIVTHKASLHFDPMGGQLGVHPAAREEVPT